MSLKQSCFKSVVKSDLKRAWWISALAALFIFISHTSQLFEYGTGGYNIFFGSARFDDALDFANYAASNYFIGMFASVFTVLFLFSYINKVNSVSFFHSLPTTRTSLLFSHITSGVIIVIFPMLINTLISLFTIGKGVKVTWILLGFAFYVLYTLVIFVVTLFVCMLTGASLASGAFTVVLVFLPMFLLFFAQTLCTDYLYGFDDYNLFEDILLDYIYLVPKSLMGVKCLIYVGFILVFGLFSLLIYKARHLENHGEVIAFPNLKGLFKVLFGFCAGILSYYYFESFWSVSSILTMFVFGIIGVIVAHMLANKSFSLKGVWKSLVVTCALIVVLFVAFFFDIFGFEKRMPDIDDIEYVEMGGMYSEYNDFATVPSEYTGGNYIKVYKKDSYKPYFKTKEEIQFFLDVHKYAVDNQKDNDDWNDDIITPSFRKAYRDYIDFTYTLKNGKTMKRSYYLPEDELETYISKIYETDTYRKWKYPILDGTEKVYRDVIIRNVGFLDNGDYVNFIGSTDEAKQIIEAIKLDRKDISYDRMLSKNYSTVVTISLSYEVPFVDNEGKVYYLEESDSYAIGIDDVNTWKLLSELDVFKDKNMLTANDVTLAEVYVEDYFNRDEYDYYYVDAAVSYANLSETVEYVYDYDYDYKYTKYAEAVQFTEYDDIVKLLDLYMNYHNPVMDKNVKYVVVHVSFDLVENTTRGRGLIFPMNEIPEVLDFIQK